jgi:hypothetical protein
MTRFISNEYKTNLANLFVDDVLANDYYLFVSTIKSSDILENTLEDKKEFLRNTLFGKRVKAEDIYYAVKNYPWQTGEVYSQYDDTDNMTDKKFFVTVYPPDSNTGDYLIFKCLSNNLGASSTAVPFYDETFVDQIYRMSDGYIWKFMYSIPEENFDDFNTFGFIPILEPETYTVDDKSISHIEVENPNTNFGYNQVDAIIVGVDNQEIRLIPNNNSVLSTAENFYRGQTFFVTNFPTFQSRLYEILTYSWDALNNYGIVTLKDEDTAGVVTYGSNVSIYPRIEVLGDGLGLNAIPVIQNSQIKSILIINGGSGYTQVTARVVDPEFNFSPDNINTGDARAIIRPILSESHGQNIKKELLCNSVILYSRVTEADNIGKLLPTSNTYSRIGVVKNPQFKEEANTSPDIFDNRISVELNGESNEFLVGGSAVQLDSLTDKTVFSSTIHEIDGNEIFLSEYMGPYQNVANTDVSFDPDLPIRDIQNNTYVINNYTLSNYVQRSGEVIYVASFTTPIPRLADRTEQYKIILQF